MPKFLPYLRFSLRTLLAVMLVLAILCAEWSRRARRQQAGVAWVMSHGGHITYDYQWPRPDGSASLHTKPPRPRWLHQLLGPDYFATVYGVVLDRDEIDDLSPLTDLPALRVVALMNYVDPDTGFAPLVSLRQLETLHLDYTRLEPARVRSLAEQMPHCQIRSDTDPRLNHN